jgi:galactofuranose transport system permease protein
MTLVIATGGIDLSVGAVIAISAAMGAVLINPALGTKLITNEILTANTTNTPLPLIVLATLAAGTLCGLGTASWFQGPGSNRWWPHSS